MWSSLKPSCTTPNHAKRTVKYNPKKSCRMSKELEAQKWVLTVPVI